MKTLTIAAAFGAALLVSHSALAAPSALAKACAADVKKYCGDVKPRKGAVADCMKSHYTDLSADCQVAYVRAAAVGKSCKADIKQFCADAKSGKRGADCLKSHAADLSSGCKDAMAKAGAGNK